MGVLARLLWRRRPARPDTATAAAARAASERALAETQQGWREVRQVRDEFVAQATAALARRVPR